MNSFRVSFIPPTVLVSGDFYWKSKDGILMYIERAFADLHGCLDLLSYADSYIERHFTEVSIVYCVPYESLLNVSEECVK